MTEPADYRIWTDPDPDEDPDDVNNTGLHYIGDDGTIMTAEETRRRDRGVFPKPEGKIPW
jgi:hypothetical protein